ncbi:hypothetical protein SLNSH_22765 [Alsobacter soli]|uniref:Uncharacterized protein n=1 Tax=Alsobacter soli TaxID=2109933 RepID=A0A2T1HM25_9HYPH|nr:hypothetical protein SLNSH_22765 [Alsobacter soli]
MRARQLWSTWASSPEIALALRVVLVLGVLGIWWELASAYDELRRIRGNTGYISGEVTVSGAVEVRGAPGQPLPVRVQ